MTLQTMRTSDHGLTLTGIIGDYDPWPGGLGPKSRAQRIMESQARSDSETLAAVRNAGTHVRGSMRLDGGAL